GLGEERDDDAPPDDEPVVSSFPVADRLTKQVMQAFVLDSVTRSVHQAMKAWPEHFQRHYQEERLRCRVPEDAFGDCDQDYLCSELKQRIDDGLATFLRDRKPEDFCGPVLLGESLTPIGARKRF